MEETISLQEIFGIIKKRFALILSMMFIGLGVAGVLTFFVITPKYSSSSQLLVNLPAASGDGTANVNDVNFNLQMINTYKQLITKSTVVAEATHEIMVKDYGFTGSPQDIQNMISVIQEQNSQMFSISATASDPKIAQGIASTTAKVFQTEAKRFLTQVEEVAIISDAPLNPNPVSPNNKLNLLIGLVLGMMVGIGLAFLVDILDKTVKDPKFLTDNLGFPILGTVPEMTEKELASKFVKVPTPQPKPTNTTGTVNETRRSRNRV